jgi:hypothetical protein
MPNAAFREKPWLIGGNGIDAEILVDQGPRVGFFKQRRERINSGRLGESASILAVVFYIRTR